MKINPEKCVACGNCTYVCPMGAIYIDPVLKRATINRDECVECYACYNGLSQEHLNPTLVRTIRRVFAALRIRFEPEPDVCPTAAFEPDELTWPRVVRRAFSDPSVPHESTGVEGRGTEEVKTNDVTGQSEGRRCWLHHRIWQTRGRGPLPRDPGNVLGPGESECQLREEKPDYLA